MDTARSGRRISTFSLPNLDCLPRRSLGGDYRTLRSLSEWPSSFFSGLVRGFATRYSTQVFTCPRVSDMQLRDIPTSARFLCRSFAPCFSLHAVLFKYNRICHLIDHRSFCIHRQDRMDSSKSVLRSIGIRCRFVKRSRNIESIVLYTYLRNDRHHGLKLKVPVEL